MHCDASLPITSRTSALHVMVDGQIDTIITYTCSPLVLGHHLAYRVTPRYTVDKIWGLRKRARLPPKLEIPSTSMDQICFVPLSLPKLPSTLDLDPLP